MKKFMILTATIVLLTATIAHAGRTDIYINGKYHSSFDTDTGSDYRAESNQDDDTFNPPDPDNGVAVDPYTGQTYQKVPGGIIDPDTMLVSPGSDGEYFNTSTGEFVHTD